MLPIYDYIAEENRRLRAINAQMLEALKLAASLLEHEQPQISDAIAKAEQS